MSNSFYKGAPRFNTLVWVFSLAFKIWPLVREEHLRRVVGRTWCALRGILKNVFFPFAKIFAKNWRFLVIDILFICFLEKYEKVYRPLTALQNCFCVQKQFFLFVTWLFPRRKLKPLKGYFVPVFAWSCQKQISNVRNFVFNCPPIL